MTESAQAVEPRKRGQRIWTDAQRAELAAKMRERAIWKKSTGPRTAAGKRISSRNSLRHGMRSVKVAEFKRFLRFNRYIVAQINRQYGAAGEGPDTVRADLI